MATDKSTHSGSWDSSSTWTQGGVPTASSEAVITAGKDVSISDPASSPATAETVTVASNGELSLAGGVLQTGSLNVQGEVFGNGAIGGAVTGDGLIAANGGTLDLAGSVGADDNGLMMRIDGASTLKLDGAVGASGALFDGSTNTSVDFAGNGVLDLTGEGSGGSGEMAQFQATVQDFDSTDKISRWPVRATPATRCISTPTPTSSP